MQTSSLTGTFILVESCPLNRDFLLSTICRHKKSLVREPGSVGQKDHPHGRVGVMWGMLAVYFGMWCCWIFVGKWRQLVASILLNCWWRPQRIWPNYANMTIEYHWYHPVSPWEWPTKDFSQDFQGLVTNSKELPRKPLHWWASRLLGSPPKGVPINHKNHILMMPN